MQSSSLEFVATSLIPALAAITPNTEALLRDHQAFIRHNDHANETRYGDLTLHTVPGVYHPHENSSSAFFARNMPQRFTGTLLDLGTGSGFLGMIAARRNAAVVATDVAVNAIHCAKNNAQRNTVEISTFVSDLFVAQEFRNLRFDTILFNLPYFHSDSGQTSDRIGADPHGILAKRFLAEAKDHLNPNGQIIFTWSNISRQEILHAAQSDWDFQVLAFEFQRQTGVVRLLYQGKPKPVAIDRVSGGLPSY